jgi:hypothetical protein
MDRLPPTLSADRSKVEPAAIVTGAASTDELSPTDKIIDPATSDPLDPDRIRNVPVDESDDAPLLKVREPEPSIPVDTNVSPPDPLVIDILPPPLEEPELPDMITAPAESPPPEPRSKEPPCL